MPLSATLRLPADARCRPALRRCAGLVAALDATVPEADGRLTLDVLALLLRETIYGETHTPLSADTALWAAACLPAAAPDLADPPVTALLGRWDASFLGWLKQVFLATGETCVVDYDHERGDTLYETARWSAGPSAETFGFVRYDDDDGNAVDEPRWQRETIYHADGRTTVDEQGQA